MTLQQGCDIMYTLKESGFEDIEENLFNKFCNDPNHNPPSHIVIPYGKRYRHVCPSCGNISYLYPDTIFCWDINES